MSKFKPKAYSVYVIVHRDGGDPEWTSRIGVTDDPKRIPEMIADNERGCRQTFGGLIDPGPQQKRTYKAFRAEWSEVPITTGKGV